MAHLHIPFISNYYQHDASFDKRSLSVTGYLSTNSLDHDIDAEAIGMVREEKRMKRTFSVDESIGSNHTDLTVDLGSKMIHRSSSVTSLSGLPQIQFRNHILTYTQRYLAAEEVEEAAAATATASVEEDVSAEAMKLVHQLIACAEAVACRDKSHASMLLSDLRSRALVFGTSFQRVASCFVQGLTDRLSLLHPLGSAGLIPPVHEIEVSSEKKEEALHLVYEICPHMKFGHFIANSTILEAFEGECSVHIIDLGMTLGLPYGHQWRSLIQSLSGQSNTPPPKQLRITGVAPQAEKFRSIGDELETYAHSHGISLVFSVVERNLENLQPQDIKVDDDETIVVNSILQLHCVVKESRGALNSVLQAIHELSPKVLVLVEQESSHNGPFFLRRFMEALHYYSAIFDSLEAMLPRYDTRRAKVEQFYFAEEIKNIVSCEGQARVERHERMDQWRRRMSRAGFQSAPIRMMAPAKEWLGKNSVCEGYTLVEEKGCLVLGWKSKPIIATSCWKC